MPLYLVRWDCDIEADTPEKAALLAQQWMDDGDTTWIFLVTDPETGEEHEIDTADEIPDCFLVTSFNDRR